MRVLHVVAQVGTYGAERFVGLLLAHGRDTQIEQGVLTVLTSPSDAANAVDVPLFDAARSGRYDVAFVARMVGLMRRWKPHIVHTHTHVGKYFGRLAAVLAGVPIIVHTEHNGFFGAPAIFRPLNRALLAYTDAVVAFSNSHRDYLTSEEGISSEKIVVIPNGIPLREHATEAARSFARSQLAAEHERILINVARFAPAKNQQLAIETLALLDKRHHLFFVGDGAERGSLEALARERGVQERVTFLGYRNDAALLLAGADALVVTSKIEGMPLTMMEAMLTGVPVVSTPWRGAAEMLGNGAYGTIASDYSPIAFAAAIESTLDRSLISSERATRASAFARTEYDINTAVRRHADLYRALSSGTRVARWRIMTARS